MTKFGFGGTKMTIRFDTCNNPPFCEVTFTVVYR
jgi:hypothetical protein